MTNDVRRMTNQMTNVTASTLGHLERYASPARTEGFFTPFRMTVRPVGAFSRIETTSIGKFFAIRHFLEIPRLRSE